MILQSFRTTLRDWRAGELRLVVAAILVAVASISAVGFFVDRMRGALSEQATQLLGADLVLASDLPVTASVRERAAALRLRVASTVQFPSMALAGPKAQLASVKAVSEGYPLRGALRVADGANMPDRAAVGIPNPGTVWVDPQLMQSLGLTVGAQIALGDASFVVERVLTLEPDRGASFVNFAPRVLLRDDDLDRTRLIQPASRVTHRLLMAGEPGAVELFRRELERSTARGQRVESLESGRPELRATLDRAERFLALVALLTALIAAVAIALATRRFAERHLDGCAVMRALGLTQARLATLLGLQLLWIGIAAGLAGVVLGWAVHFVLVAAIAPLMEMRLPMPTLWPALQAVASGLVLLLGFGGFPFLGLAGVTPLRVLRRDIGRRGAGAWMAACAAAAAFGALLLWFANDRMLAMVAIGGFAGGAVLFAAAAYAAVRSVGPLRRVLAGAGGSASLRLALASWSRRQGATVAQTVALAVGLMALTLLTVTRTDLIDGWRAASPADAPNRFVINIQPDQREELSGALLSQGVRAPELFPMIRGRLVTVNDRPVDASAFSDERARRLVDREFNLSYMEAEPGHNRTVEGRWLDPRAAEVSAEQGIMKTLGLTLGDTLGFEIAGETVQAKVTGVRKLAWDSMKVNFFMILSPALLSDRPQTLITAYHQAPGDDGLDGRLVRQFPNLTVFDTGNIVRQVQTMLEQVIRAVQFLFVLTLVAGVVVLYAALASSRDDRIREAGLMRALGASRRQLGRAQLWELGIGGAIAGLLAAAGALAIGSLLARQVFQFAYSPRWETLLIGMLCGAVVAIAAGWMGLRGVLASPPLATLRELP